jgi:deoxyribonuclease V
VKVGRDLHPWNVSPKKAFELQSVLVSNIHLYGPPLSMRLAAGVDVSILGDKAIASIVVISVPEMQIVTVSSTFRPVDFPYVPGLLAFREGPVILGALEMLDVEPDAIFFDGHGIAHPRCLGIASHIGLWVAVPTIGVAKSILVGKHRKVRNELGAKASLKFQGQRVGYALRSKADVKPIYVSSGNRISLDSAVRAVLRVCKGYRLPEPTRLAHCAATLAAKGLSKERILDTLLKMRRSK